LINEIKIDKFFAVFALPLVNDFIGVLSLIFKFHRDARVNIFYYISLIFLFCVLIVNPSL